MSDITTTVLPPDRVVTTVVTPPAPPTATVQAGQGPAGPPGPQGIQGVPGPVTGDLSYTHDQMTASAAWTVVHSLGKMPSIAVVDSSGAEVEGGVNYVDINSVLLTFSAAFSGKAYLN